MTKPCTTDTDETSTLRHQLADRLAESGHIRTPGVDKALRTASSGGRPRCARRSQ